MSRTTRTDDGTGVLGLDSGLAALQRSPEFRGPVESLDGHHCNDHFALLFERPEEQFDALVPFLRQGLERGERCMYVVDELAREDILAVLREAGVDVDAALASGQLSFHTVGETYLRDGTFDPDEMIEFYAGAIEEATAEYEALRIAAETTWLQATGTAIEDFMEYEAKVNDLFDDEDCIAMCTYDRRAFPPEVVRDIVRTHPHLIYDGTVCHNFYHTPPEEFFGPEEPAREVDRMMNTMLERSEAKSALEEREWYLRRQNEITADPDRSFEEKLQALFELGCQRFDLEVGAMARVDTDADRFEIEHVSHDHAQFEPGLELPLSETYCPAAIERGGAASVVDPVAAGYDAVHVYREFGIEAYHGTHVEIEGDLDRTFFFTSEEPRDTEFSEDERTFLQLIGQWVKYELERRQRERELERSNAVMEALGDPVYAVDDEGRFTFVNEAFDDVFGYDRDELLGEHVSVLMDESGIERARGLIAELLADDERHSGIFERTAVTAGGERRHCEDHMALLAPDADDGFRGTAGVVRDVTEHKEREQELRQTKNRFETVFEDSDDSIFIIDPDADEFVDANPAAAEMTGYARDELLSQPPSALYPDELEQFRTFLDEVRETGSAWSEDLHCRHEDGHDIPAEISASAITLDGRELVLALVRDISERKTHERYQRKLYEITADPDLPTDEKIERLLAVGCEHLSLPLGMLNRDFEETLEIQQLCGAHPELDEGTLIPPSSENYCRRVVETDDPVTVVDAEGAGWEGDPLYDEVGLETYAGVPVTVGSNTYGTLCFADTAPRTTEFTEAEQAFLDLLSQCVGYELDQTHRETRLHALSGIGRELLDAETVADVAEGVVTAVEDAFERPMAAVALYNDETGDLRPAAHTDAIAELVEAAPLFDGPDGIGWKAFIESEPKRVADPLDRGEADTSANPPVSEAVVHPLGDHGVFLVGAVAPDGFRDSDTEAIETAAATMRAALARVDREHKLEEREQALEEQNETLERLDRVNDIIRSIDNSLVQASTRSEIETVVCEQLAGVGPYELAWIGEHDPVEETVGPIEWAGAEKGYLDGITIRTDDSPTGNGPTGRAVRTGEPQVVNDVLENASFEPWRQAALNRGYHASIALPLAYEDTLYGVLNVYAGQPGVFDDLEEAVLTELADTIAYAINAVESKKALVSDAVTELEFAVDDGGLGVVELVEETGCSFSHESLVPRTDGQLGTFFSTRGVPADDVFATERRLPVSELELVAEREEDGEPVCLFQATLTGESLPATVLDHGGRISDIAAADGSATVTVHLAGDANVREFSEMFRSNYPDSELVAQRSRELSRRTPSEFTAALTEELTARQQEVLQMAFYSGYFESPRSRTGSEIADGLDIAQPTFNAHLRTAQRKLCRLLFEDESSPA